MIHIRADLQERVSYGDSKPRTSCMPFLAITFERSRDVGFPQFRAAPQYGTAEPAAHYSGARPPLASRSADLSF
jgi:hypothetical protein